uniref:Uncharacterized protein n=1 Tax=Rhizophora mucronata TaxID=61149 RepID=A0A2P2PDS3_RHIMU
MLLLFALCFSHMLKIIFFFQKEKKKVYLVREDDKMRLAIQSAADDGEMETYRTQI